MLQRFVLPRLFTATLVAISMVSTWAEFSIPFMLSPALAKTTDPNKAEADQVLKSCRDSLQQRQYSAAIASCQQAADSLQTRNNPDGEARAWNNLGSAYVGLSQFEPARQAYQKALVIFQAQGDRPGQGFVLLGLGILHHDQGDYRRAIEFHQQALTIAREVQNRQEEGLVLASMGDAYYGLKDYKQALEAYQQTLAIAKALKDGKQEATTLGNVGNVYYRQGEYPRAIELYQQRLTLAQALQDRQETGFALGNLAMIYETLEDYGQAFAYHQQRLTIAKEIKDLPGEQRALAGLGRAYYNLGNYQRANEFHGLAWGLARELKDRRAEGNAQSYRGLTYHALGVHSKAIAAHQEHLSIARELQDRRGEAGALGNLGLVYDTLGDYTRAIEFHQQNLTIARELKDRWSEGQALGNLGNAYYYLKNYPQAIAYYQQQLTIAREVGHRRGEGNALNNLGTSYLYTGDAVAAETPLRQAVKVYESLPPGLTDDQKVSAFETHLSAYHFLQQSLVRQGKWEAALEIAERGRAQAFLELLTSKIRNNPSPQSQPTTIASIKQVAKEQNATLVEYSIINHPQVGDMLYAWVVKPTGEVAFAQTQLSNLPRDQGKTALQTLLNQVRISDLGVRSRSLSFQEDPAVISAIATQIPTGSSDYLHLKQLHQLLIAPIAQHLPKDPNQRVVFIPQGELFFVPFAALQTADGKFLIEQHTITTAPAIQVLHLTKERREKIEERRANPSFFNLPSSILIVGNPTMPKIGDPPQALSSLPGAEDEAKAIAKLFGATPLIGAQASKATVVKQMQSARLIHLATHGLLDDYKGLGVPGAIALSPDANPTDKFLPNGLLTAGEILDLKLQADLIVLSACDTGRGRITGDGVIGLSRSLISAGTPSVLVSLWKVPDDSTNFLMQEFYKNLQQGKLNKAQALRQAMLTSLKKYPEPKDWAAFTLMGEAE